jgi:hypothetical protein
MRESNLELMEGLARLGVVCVDGEWRRLKMTGGELRLQFEDHESSRQACLREEVAGGLAVLQGFTVWLGGSPIDGDERDRRARFSGWEEMEQRRKKSSQGFVLGYLYGAWARA